MRRIMASQRRTPCAIMSHYKHSIQNAFNTQTIRIYNEQLISSNMN